MARFIYCNKRSRGLILLHITNELQVLALRTPPNAWKLITVRLAKFPSPSLIPAYVWLHDTTILSIALVVDPDWGLCFSKEVRTC